MSEGGEDGHVGVDGMVFPCDILRGGGIRVEGIGLFAGGVIKDEDAFAEGAAMVAGLDEAKALLVEVVGVPLGLGEEVLKGLVGAEGDLGGGGLEVESLELQKEGGEVAQEGGAQTRGADRGEADSEVGEGGRHGKGGVDHLHTPWDKTKMSALCALRRKTAVGRSRSKTPELYQK